MPGQVSKTKSGILDKWQESFRGMSVFGKIQCPKNKVLIPGRHAFKIKPNPHAKNMTEGNRKFLSKMLGTEIRKWVYVRDRFGNKIPDPTSFYMPPCSPAYILENVYAEDDYICAVECKHQCVRKVGGNTNVGLLKRAETAKSILC
jgi:hypothetical protein